MSVITLPTIPWNSSVWNFVRSDIPIKLMSGAEVIVENVLGTTWELGFTLAPRNRSEARVLASRLRGLAKIGNVFESGPPDYILSSGYAGPDPQVVGGSQLGNTLDCSDVSVTTLIVQEGDYMSVLVNTVPQLLEIIADATSDGAGLVTFVFEPALRGSPLDNAVVELNNPVAQFRLVEPEHAVAVDLAAFRTMQINAVESFSP